MSNQVYIYRTYTYEQFIRKLFSVNREFLPTFVKKETTGLQKKLKQALHTGRRKGTKYSKLPHVSSSPGEFPRSQSGTLANSIKKAVKTTGAGTKGSVFTDLFYAKYLEEGTPKGQMKPRPFFKPTMEKEIPPMVNRLKTELRSYFNNVY